MSLEKVLGSVGSFCVNHKFALLATAGVIAVGIGLYYGLKWILNRFILPAQIGAVCPKSGLIRSAYSSKYTNLNGELVQSNIVEDHFKLLPYGDEIQYKVFDNSDYVDPKNKDKTLIVFNPNAATSENTRDATYGVLSKEYGRVVYWDYPNTGRSKSGSGYINAKRLVEAGKAVEARIHGAYHRNDKDHNNIYFYGWSLGGGVAACAAYSLQNAGIKIGGLICDRTFTSLTDFAKKNFMIPRFMAGSVLKHYGLEMDTKTAFEAFEGPKNSIYSVSDEVIRNAVLKGEGKNYTRTTLSHCEPLQYSADAVNAIGLAR